MLTPHPTSHFPTEPKNREPNSFSPLLFRDEQRRARVVTSLGRRCARLALLGLGFVSVRFEDVGGDELPANYPLTPPIEEEGNGADGGGGES